MLGTGNIAKSDPETSKRESREKTASSEPSTTSPAPNAKSAMLMAAISKNSTSAGKNKSKTGLSNQARFPKKLEDKGLEKKQNVGTPRHYKGRKVQ